MNINPRVIWGKLNSFGRAAFIFRLVGYLFYSSYLLLVLHENKQNISWQHIFLISIALLLPFLFALDYYRNNNNKRVLQRHFSTDYFLLGFYIGLIHFAYIPSVLFLICSIANHVAAIGYRKAIRFLLIPLGIGLYLLFFGGKVAIESSFMLNALALGYTFVQLNILAFINYNNAKSLYKAKIKVNDQRTQLIFKSNELINANKELKELNTGLELKVVNRTQELEAKNNKLAEYAFINGHQLRAPVATMLGLIQLLDYPMDEQERKLIIKKLNYEVNLLNVTIKEIRLRLESDEMVNEQMNTIESNHARVEKFNLRNYKKR